jgi:hypothetical protein
VEVAETFGYGVGAFSSRLESDRTRIRWRKSLIVVKKMFLVGAGCKSASIDLSTRNVIIMAWKAEGFNIGSMEKREGGSIDGVDAESVVNASEFMRERRRFGWGWARTIRFVRFSGRRAASFRTYGRPC